MRLKILTTNHHTGYLYLLSHTGHQFHALDYEGWGKLQQRPLPPNVSLWPPGQDVHVTRYDCVVGHKPFQDLLSLGIKSLARGIPYIQVIHGRRQRTGHRPSYMRRLAKAFYGWTVLRFFSNFRHFRLVFISDTVKKSWSLPGTVIYPGVPITEFKDYTGRDSTLLIVGNNLHREHFDLEAILLVAKALPLKIIGANPAIPGSATVSTWDELKSMYSCCRAYLNVTRAPEDGYNLATLEAMASGMPIVTLYHPTSPIVDGYNGLVAYDRYELIIKAGLLLKDYDLSRTLGKNSRQTAEERFHITRFVQAWNGLFDEMFKTKLK